MCRLIPPLLMLALTSCAGVGQDADFPDRPDAIPSGPGALSGGHGEFVLYSTTGSESGKRKAGAVGDAQSRYGTVVSPSIETPAPSPGEREPTQEKTGTE